MLISVEVVLNWIPIWQTVANQKINLRRLLLPQLPVHWIPYSPFLFFTSTLNPSTLDARVAWVMMLGGALLNQRWIRSWLVTCVTEYLSLYQCNILVKNISIFKLPPTKNFNQMKAVLMGKLYKLCELHKSNTLNNFIWTNDKGDKCAWWGTGSVTVLFGKL